MTFTIRPVAPAQYDEALALWRDVFGVHDEYFTRYYHGDPWYRPGDTLGAWVGGRLVSTVHTCRRPVNWERRTLVCAAVANVATLPDQRGRGLSRALLSAATARWLMDEFSFGQLGTGIPGFYERQGWEVMPMGKFHIALERSAPSPPAHKLVAGADILERYSRSTRPLLLQRSPQYMADWVSYEHGKLGTETWAIDDRGYITARFPQDGSEAQVQEWVAPDAVAEQALILAALRAAQDHGITQVSFHGMPQFIDPLIAFETLGTVTLTPEAHAMVRNISLTDAEYSAVKGAYIAGQATCWPADWY